MPFTLVTAGIPQGASVGTGEPGLNVTPVQTFFAQQPNFQQAIPSTGLVLPVLKASPALRFSPGTGGPDLSAGTSCSGNRQSGGTALHISPQEEDEKIRAVQEYIRETNLSWTAGKTSVSNLTPAAYTALRGLKHPAPGESFPVRGIGTATAIPGTALPASFDWRNNGGDWTTPIQNQGGCGSCWAFASTATFESFWERIQNNPGLDPDFAEQYLVSCDSEDTGCDGGFSSSLGYFIDKAGSSGGVGTVVDSDYPYTASDSRCKSLTGKTRYTVPAGGSWSYLAGDCVIDTVAKTKQAIYAYGPLNAYVDATDNFMYYTSGIFEDPDWTDGGACATNHVIQLVGWGHDPVKNKDYWIAKNSWGTSWGEDGWFRIYTDQCRIGEGVAYLAAKPNTSFTATPTSGDTPLKVIFTDHSTNFPTKWYWSFGDGSLVNATKQNPEHTYTMAGTYTVSLNATNAFGSNTTTRTNYITAIARPTPTAIIADSSSSSDNELAPARPSVTNIINAGGTSAVNRVIVTGTGITGLIVTGTGKPRPGDGPYPPGIVYQYIDLVPARYSTISEAEIFFSVPQSWLEQHQISPENVILSHLTGHSWISLPTKVLKTKDGYVYYSATSPGFSLFAIAGVTGNLTSTPTLTPVTTALTIETPLTTIPVKVPDARSVATEQTTAAPATSAQPSASTPLTSLLLIVTALIIVGASGFLVRRWWIRRQNPALFREND